uniref:Tetratricopeptide repeat protein n=1 Tax=Dunaliella tertiolecta TaxID=3047 RepID=A0A7S3QXK2_DUNTE|mmetsp:Transcript_10459/g.27273  ORF Transcript_10459/g.27273 Transcript_10459/m.27273 type:complete len:251 (-) Transcript_10459:410-1162(-)
MALSTKQCTPVNGTKPRRPQSQIAVSRRTTLGGAALLGGMHIVDSASAISNGPSPRYWDPTDLVIPGMQKFRDLDLDGAASDFDEAWLRAPSVRPFLWQRGIALYFQSRFPEAADQFRSDVAVNPRNTEEAIWAFISEARMDGPSQARANFVQVPQDPRPVIQAAYESFKNGGGPEKILASSRRDGDQSDFYARLYAGLYFESMNVGLFRDNTAAKKELLAACATPYAQQSDDYYAAVARLHVNVRGWSA